MTRNSAWIAAILSFVFPGLGHAYLGRRRAALVFALPAFVTAVAITLDLLISPDGALAFAITPSGSLTWLFLIALTGVWRIIAIGDVILVARRGGDPHVLAGVAVGVVCIGLVAGMHGVPMYYAYSVYDASSAIFVDPGPDQAGVTPYPSVSTSPDPSGTSAAPSIGYEATPFATPPTAASRITVLLTGIDSDPTRAESLTDTLMVVSVNPVDGSVTMASIPRDISNFRMYNGKTYSGKINSLMTWASNHPQQYPDGPFPTLIHELSFLLGVPINYYAAVNLSGFSQMVDLVGGVTVVNPQPINDPSYAWLDGTHGFSLPAGKVTLDGKTALAYARSRKGAGDNDFTRARRQQQLLLALRAKLTTPSMLLKVPGILSVAKGTVRTDLPQSRFEDFINLAQHIDASKVQSFVLGPNTYASQPPMSQTGGVYELVLNMTRIKKWSIDQFGTDSTYYAAP